MSRKKKDDPTLVERPWDAAAADVQEDLLRAALENTRGNVSAAARELKISRSHVNRFLTKFELAAFATELRVAAGGTRILAGPRKGQVGPLPSTKPEIGGKR